MFRVEHQSYAKDERYVDEAASDNVASARSKCPFRAELTLVANSGMLVQKHYCGAYDDWGYSDAK